MRLLSLEKEIKSFRNQKFDSDSNNSYNTNNISVNNNTNHVKLNASRPAHTNIVAKKLQNGKPPVCQNIQTLSDVVHSSIPKKII